VELKIKEKQVNGKKVSGIITENLKVITPFIFETINKSGNFYICTMEDGRQSVYNSKGTCLLSYEEEYKDLKELKISMRNCGYFYGTKEEKVGILRLSYNYVKDIEVPEVYEAYKFGACDEIEEMHDGTIKLIKHNKTKDKIGYFYHPNFPKLVKPEFITYDYYRVNAKSLCINTKEDDRYYDKSSTVEKGSLTFNIELVKFSKIKNKREVFGLKQKTVTERTDYTFKTDFADLFKCEYSKIEYDEERQIFMLEKIVDGKIMKGFVGVAIEWDLQTRGSEVSGYANFNPQVSLPCEFEEIRILPKDKYETDSYVIVKKDGKYGMYKFWFKEKFGDYNYYDYYNRKTTAESMFDEIAPCIYDSIEVKDVSKGMIAKINDEEQIVMDVKTNGKYVNIKNKYKKVNILDENIYLCEKKNGNKVLVLVSKEDYFNREYKTVITEEIACDDVELFKSDSDKNVIKVTKDNISDIYIINPNIMKIVENIVDIKQDARYPKYFKVTKENQHICYVNYEGVVFDTEKLNIVPSNLDVEYLESIYMFKVSNNGIINLYNNKCLCGNKIYENRDYVAFDAVGTYNHTFVGYTEKEEKISKLFRVRLAGTDITEVDILEGIFNVDNIILNGERIIYSIFDNHEGKIKYGVIETIEGNSCIECEYDSIKFDANNNVFVATLNNENYLFDIDGFTIEIEDYENKYHKIENTLSLNLKK